MSINLQLPENPKLKPKIVIFGIGGAGGNAVSNMIMSNLQGVDFVVANTDAQALDNSSAEKRIQLGEVLTKGLGAGASPDVGRAAAEENITDIAEQLHNTHMIFITAGMGGGTGTGAAPVIARLAKEQNILTVGVVTKPFHFEGARRMRAAEAGIEELQKYVDTLIIIPNQNLFRVATEKTTFADAFKLADNVLHSGVRGVTDLITMPGLINLDFADIRAVMSEMGKAMMGTGEAEGENRAIAAAEAAISNPLLDSASMKGARGVLINITGGADMTLFEVDEAANRIRDEVDADANIIFGSAFNEDLSGRVRVSVVATGIDRESYQGVSAKEKKDYTAHPASTVAQAVANPKVSQYAQINTTVMDQFSSHAVQTQAATSTPVRVEASVYSEPSDLEKNAHQADPRDAERTHFEEELSRIKESYIPPQPVDPGLIEGELDLTSGNENHARSEAVSTQREGASPDQSLSPMMDASKDQKGIFSRMAGAAAKSFGHFNAVGETLDVKRESQSDVVVLEREPQKISTPKENPMNEGKFSSPDDVFDIPAFLRRKPEHQ